MVVISSSVSSGVVTICLAVASIFCYLRRRRRRCPRAPPAVSAVPAGVGTSKLHVDEILQPVTYERMSLSGQPRSYVRIVARVFVPRVALVSSCTAFCWRSRHHVACARDGWIYVRVARCPSPLSRSLIDAEGESSVPSLCSPHSHVYI